MLLQQGFRDTNDGRLSGICIDEAAAIDVDAGMIVIAQQGSYTCRYCTCKVLREGHRFLDVPHVEIAT